MGAVKIPAYTCRQSRFPHAPKLPCLGLCSGPSMSGKSNLLVKLITEVWRHEDGKSCFERIYVFSPSVTVDPIWRPVRAMFENEILDMSNRTITRSSSSLMSRTSTPCPRFWTSSSPSWS